MSRHVPYFVTYQRLNVHVYASAWEVIRTASRKMIAPRSRFSREQRAARHAFFRAMLAHHAEARDIVRRYQI